MLPSVLTSRLQVRGAGLFYAFQVHLKIYTVADGEHAFKPRCAGEPDQDPPPPLSALW
jgi:hypothetical protein